MTSGLQNFLTITHVLGFCFYDHPFFSVWKTILNTFCDSWNLLQESIQMFTILSRNLQKETNIGLQKAPLILPHLYMAWLLEKNKKHRLQWKLKDHFSQMQLYASESESWSVVSNSLQPHGLYRPWNSPGQNTGLGSCSLLQGIFPSQGSNPGLPHCRQILYQVNHRGSPRKWNGQLIPSLEDLPNPGIQSRSPALQVDSLP